MNFISPENRKMFATVSEFKTFAKPDKEETRFISEQLESEQSIREVTPESLAHELTGEAGSSSFTPAVFRRKAEIICGKSHNTLKRSNHHWHSQEFYAIDIDNGISFRDFIARCTKYNILPVFVYETFSNENPENPEKFRAVFLSDQTCENFNLFNIIQISLMSLFPEADKSCKDRARMYFGGKSILYENYESRINTDDLITKTCQYITECNDTSRNTPRAIRKYCKNIGVNCRDNLPDIVEVDREKVAQIDDFTANPYNIYIIDLCGVFVKINLLTPSNCHQTNLADKTLSSSQTYRGVKNIDLSQNCQLWEDFTVNAYAPHIEHHHRWGLASNIYLIEGGKSWFLQSIANVNPAKEFEWENNIKHIKHKEYSPQNCENFHCPYTDECDHANNILNTIKYDVIKVVENIPAITTLEAEIKLRSAIFSKPAKGSIHLIKSITGIGKTKISIDYIMENDCKGIVMAVPTHALKDELIEKISNIGGSIISTPKLPEIKDDISRAELQRYYDAGLYRHANSLLERLALKDQAIDRYLKELEEAEHSDKSLITTHARILTMRDTQRTELIIDEDPTSTLLQQRHTTLNDLNTIAELINNRKMNNYINNLNHDNTIITNMKNIFTDTEINYIANKMARFGIKTNILGLFNSDYYVSHNGHINYITKKQLPGYDTTKILSATLDFYLIGNIIFSDYNWKYENELIDISNVQLRGTLKQYVSKSTSRHALKNTPKRIEKIKTLIDEKDVILTFKDNESSFENSGGHFGALEGLDKYNGQNLAIVGTPHINPLSYRLKYAVINNNIIQPDLQMKTQTINRNGLEFKFYTFTDVLLQKIQLHSIESELIQAIGRARLTRSDAVVTLFSNYPIPGAAYLYNSLTLAS
jgi:hypothetical protein